MADGGFACGKRHERYRDIAHRDTKAKEQRESPSTSASACTAPNANLQPHLLSQRHQQRPDSGSRQQRAAVLQRPIPEPLRMLLHHPLKGDKSGRPARALFQPL